MVHAWRDRYAKKVLVQSPRYVVGNVDWLMPNYGVLRKVCEGEDEAKRIEEHGRDGNPRQGNKYYEQAAAEKNVR
jgi:hypothetical protein